MNFQTRLPIKSVVFNDNEYRALETGSELAETLTKAWLRNLKTNQSI